MRGVTHAHLMWLLAAEVSCFACQKLHEPAPTPSLTPVHPSLEGAPRGAASGEFRSLWYDGNAELSGYRVTMPRYGELRQGELVLIYVTEPMNRHTWIKDDAAKPPQRVDVLKLNYNLSFLAGIYPYSVMTSVFTPIDDWGAERFAPVKITTTVQEWCGHVFQGLWPGRGSFQTQVVSYFAAEGERTITTPAPENTLYEDALLIQLRELDGPFAGGGDWEGYVVPSLWRIRRSHEPPATKRATIRRSVDRDGGQRVNQFVLETADYRRTFDVEIAAPHRMLGWTTSNGEAANVLRTVRLPYWKLNHRGDESYREQLGLADAAPAPPPMPPSGTTSVGR